MPPSAQDDLLAHPKGLFITDVLTDEQKKKLDEMVDDFVRDKIKERIKDIGYKPFELALEAEKKEIQNAAAYWAFPIATAICGGDPACGPPGSLAAWYAAGKAFDKVLHASLDSLISPTAARPTPSPSASPR
jgi:hypothetical protein